MTEMGKERGFDMHLLSRWGEMLAQEGLEAIECQDIPVPLGEWAGHVGAMLKADVLSAFDALKGTYCSQAKVPLEQFDALVRRVAQEWELSHASYIFSRGLWKASPAMMSTAPPLQISREQAERLLQYMQEYRRYALASVPPTRERNTTLRLIQALQGKLLVLVDQMLLQVHLSLTKEEAHALKAMTKVLLLFYGEKPDSSERTRTVTDIGRLYTYLKQIYG